jgi:hypothetical protein
VHERHRDCRRPLLPDCKGTGDYDGAAAVLTMIGLGLGLATLVFSLTTLLLGRPRFLIPPFVRPGRPQRRGPRATTWPS